MPGENCAIVGCSTNRRHKDISLFKLPTAKPNDETTMSWRKAMLNVITRDRAVDSDFRQQINIDKVYICERYFLPGDLYICKSIYVSLYVKIYNIKGLASYLAKPYN